MALTIEKCRKLVALDPSDPLSRFALGRKLYENSENLPEAAEHLRFANRAAPGHLATYHVLARALIALGERAEAREVLTRGLARVAEVGEGMGRDLGPAMSLLLRGLDERPAAGGFSVRLASGRELVDLRWRVLRADLDRSAAVFEGDELSTTLHAVAELAGRVVACGTLMLQDFPMGGAAPSFEGAVEAAGRTMRLRGMATDESVRGRGAGSALLRLLESEAAGRQVGLLWCNARIGAVRFYESAGWKVVSAATYEIATAGLHHTMVKRL